MEQTHQLHQPGCTDPCAIYLHSHKGILTFPPRKALHLPYRWVNSRTDELYCRLNTSVENAIKKKAPKFCLAASTVKQFPGTWEKGRLWRDTFTAPHLEETGQCPGLKGSHTALKTESEGSLHKNFQGFGTCISYILWKSQSSALEVWKQTKDKSSEFFLLQYYTLILIFFCYSSSILALQGFDKYKLINIAVLH